MVGHMDGPHMCPFCRMDTYELMHVTVQVQYGYGFYMAGSLVDGTV